MRTPGDRRKAALEQLAAELRTRLEQRHPGEVLALALAMVGDTHVIRGGVASEACRADARRLLLGFDGVFKVRDELEVTGFLVAATAVDDEDDFFGLAEGKSKGSTVASALSASSGADRGPGRDETIHRRATANLDGRVAAGEEVVVTVDLRPDPALGIGVSVGPLPSGWSEVRVSVRLSSKWLAPFNVGGRQVALFPDGTSSPARFLCKVSEDLPNLEAIGVDASFLHGTRICGQARWTFATARAAGPRARPARGTAGTKVPPNAVSGVGASTPAPDIRVLPQAYGPTLLVEIDDVSDQEQRWDWTLATHEGRELGMARSRLGNTAAEYAAHLLTDCPGLGPLEHRRRMSGVGERIWKACPSEFREAFLRCRRTLEPGFPIQFLTADPHVPWELMKPDVEGADHVFLEHPTARWPILSSSRLLSRLPRGAVVSFVPEYRDAGTLPSAREELAWLRDAMGALVPEPERASFLDLLDGRGEDRVGVLHFAGHGRAASGGETAAIRMSDGWVTVDDVDQAAVKLGDRDHPVVVLNACEAASDHTVLGINSGWAPTLARRGFSALIAPLWAVQDRVAFEVIKSALLALDGASTLGEAVRDARRSNVAASVAAFAYLAHGDVMARMDAPATPGA